MRQRQSSDLEAEIDLDQALRSVAKRQRKVDHVMLQESDITTDSLHDRKSEMRGENILSKALDQVSVDQIMNA